ncbi:MAG: NAD-binding protein [Firmicutes bacterium]|nr:NAD-binding protein [Bacillota bacterium]
MRIYIFGCGRIGTCILDHLTATKHEIIAIDNNPEVIDQLNETKDIMAICADASNFHVIEELNIAKADVVVACTESNDLNLFICRVAGQLGAKYTIAQVRKPDYYAESLLQLEKLFDVDHVYNPDLTTAEEIVSTLDFKSDSLIGLINTPSVMILGASKASVHLCRLLVRAGFEVKIIEKDAERCYRTSELVPDQVLITCADGTEKTILFEEGIDSVDAFVALTDFDEQNLLVSVYAASRKVPKVITKVRNNAYNKLVSNLGLDCIIAPKEIAAKHVADCISRLEAK